jgi:hypothetical protein
MNTMEPSLLIKMLSLVLASSALVYLLLLRPWRPARMKARLLPSIDIMFVIGLAFGTAALYEEVAFPRMAGVLVDQTGLPASVADVDRRIEHIEQLPTQLWNDLVERFSWTEVEEPLPPEPAPPIARSEPGLVEGTLVPAVTSVVEVLLRTVVYWSSLMVLALCQVMRLASAAIRRFRRREAPTTPALDVASLHGRISAIEERIAALPARAG